MKVTIGWVIYRPKLDEDDQVEFLGIFPTEEKARREIKVMSQVGNDDLEMAPVPFRGWGYIGSGDFDHNDASDQPLKS
ncbi:hypothetical protein [Rhodoligotrophos ferricapiens]|uniref:hypothetical protein n=1 Tax=Rhodoligotrophos ferricapiens TaxID=3069264 RepID=UPI00315CA802